MKYNFFIRNVEFEKRIEMIVSLGKKQGGFITKEQLSNKLSGVDLYPLQLDQLHQSLEENGIYIKVNQKPDYKECARKYYFLNDSEVNLNGVKQVDKCLSLEEFAELFLARYDENMNKQTKKEIKQKLATKIKHVETCKDCLRWCKYGHELYNSLFYDTNKFSAQIYFKFFNIEYQKWHQVNNKSEDQEVKKIRR